MNDRQKNELQMKIIELYDQENSSRTHAHIFPNSITRNNFDYQKSISLLEKMNIFEKDVIEKMSYPTECECIQMLYLVSTRINSFFNEFGSLFAKNMVEFFHRESK